MSTWETLGASMKRSMRKRDAAKVRLLELEDMVREAKEDLTVAELEFRDAKTAYFELAVSIHLEEDRT